MTVRLVIVPAHGEVHEAVVLAGVEDALPIVRRSSPSTKDRSMMTPPRY
jgi:hypothetical protein